MKIERVIIDKILEWNFTPGERKKSSLNKQVKHLKEILYKPENYLSYNVCNGKLIKLVFAEFSDTPFELDRINVSCFYFEDISITKKNVCDELINLREHFAPKKLKIVVGGREGQDKLYRLLKRLGFTSNGG
jgi:hypothetical protein